MELPKNLPMKRVDITLPNKRRTQQSYQIPLEDFNILKNKISQAVDIGGFSREQGRALLAASIYEGLNRPYGVTSGQTASLTRKGDPATEFIQRMGLRILPELTDDTESQVAVTRGGRDFITNLPPVGTDSAFNSNSTEDMFNRNLRATMATILFRDKLAQTGGDLKAAIKRYGPAGEKLYQPIVDIISNQLAQEE
jgi:hypothetical protein